MFNGSKKPFLILALCYWIPLLILPPFCFWVFPKYNYIGIIIWAISTIVGIIVSWKSSDIDFKTYFWVVMMRGIHRIAKRMTVLQRSKEHPEKPKKWEKVFEVWWGISIKFLISPALVWMIYMQLVADTEAPYGSYEDLWHWIGNILPVLGFAGFFACLAFCTKDEERNSEEKTEMDKAMAVDEEELDEFEKKYPGRMNR